ncbi:S26 family signal peptidase [Nonomuraea sp. NPDC004297]
MNASVLLAVAVAVAVLAIAGALVVRLRRAYSTIRVDGFSMTPALTDGDRLLARRLPASALRNGHIAMVRSPLPMGGPFLIKRIVALPGDPVPESVRGIVPDERVPDGRLVVIGDNVDASFDSRDHGYFSMADVHAVAIRKLTSADDPSGTESTPARHLPI